MGRPPVAQDYSLMEVFDSSVSRFITPVVIRANLSLALLLWIVLCACGIAGSVIYALPLKGTQQFIMCVGILFQFVGMYLGALSMRVAAEWLILPFTHYDAANQSAPQSAPVAPPDRPVAYTSYDASGNPQEQGMKVFRS